MQRLEIIAPLAAKQEQMAAERVGTDDLLGLCRQTVESVAQIDRAAREENLCTRREGDQTMPFIARSTRANAFSLTEASTRNRTPLGRSTSIIPAPEIVDIAARSAPV
jgi:hypothetical protein